MSASDFARSFPAASTSDHWGDRVVCQGHADYCAANGHATWKVDGVDRGICPRCGVVTIPAPEPAPKTIPANADDHAEVYAELAYTLEAIDYVDAQVENLVAGQTLDPEQLGIYTTAELTHILEKLDAIAQHSWGRRIDQAATDSGRMLTAAARRATTLAAAIRSALESL